MCQHADELIAEIRLVEETAQSRERDGCEGKVDVEDVEARHVVDHDGLQTAEHALALGGDALVEFGFEGAGGFECLLLAAEPGREDE